MCNFLHAYWTDPKQRQSLSGSGVSTQRQLFRRNPVESGFSYIRYADKATLSRQYAPQRMNALNSTIAFWEKVVRNIAGSGEGGH